MTSTPDPLPMLVPDSLHTPAEGLSAVADRMVWAFGTSLARVPGFRWWRVPSAVVWWAEMRGHQDQFATSEHAHLRVTTTTASGKPDTTGKDQLVGMAIALGWVFVVAAILYGAEMGLAYAGVPARVVADTTNTIGLVLALSVLGELVFVLAQGWRRAKVLPKGREALHRAGHCGLVVIMSNYGARPWKKGHGDVVMRKWLAHADAHNIAVIADARNKKARGEVHRPLRLSTRRPHPRPVGRAPPCAGPGGHLMHPRHGSARTRPSAGGYRVPGLVAAVVVTASATTSCTNPADTTATAPAPLPSTTTARRPGRPPGVQLRAAAAPVDVAEPTQCRFVSYWGSCLPYGYSRYV